MQNWRKVKNRISRYTKNRSRKHKWTAIVLLGLSPVIFIIFYSIAAYSLFDPIDLEFVTESGQPIRQADGVIQVRYLGDPANVVPVKFDQIPSSCIDGIVAAEDRSFFSNPGYDFAGLARGIYDEFANDNFGGSSITHQVIKIGTSRYFDRDFSDKYHEVIFGLKLNSVWDKEKILENYLNNVYLGNFNYGIGAAARNYFGKSVMELSLGECAFLVGLPQQPSVYHPFKRPDLGIRRQYLVLNQMLLQGEITTAEFKDAINAELKFEEQSILLSKTPLSIVR